MGIKSKIKGSYAYTQWKLGKYTKRRVKTSVSPDWAIERQEYERERANSYSDNFYHNRELENYKPSFIKNNGSNYSGSIRDTDSVEAQNIPSRPMSTIVNPNNNFNNSNNNNNGSVRRDMNGNPIRYSAIDTEKYSNITLQKSDFEDVLVPSRNYTLVQKSNSSSVAYYSPGSAPAVPHEGLPRNYSYTTNIYPSRAYDKRNI